MFAIGDADWPGLGKLVEECGELQAVAGRLLATHGDPRHWSGADLRRDYLHELADVGAATRFAEEVLSPGDRAFVRERADAKLRLFRGWHAQVSDDSPTDPDRGVGVDGAEGAAPSRSRADSRAEVVDLERQCAAWSAGFAEQAAEIERLRDALRAACELGEPRRPRRDDLEDPRWRDGIAHELLPIFVGDRTREQLHARWAELRRIADGDPPGPSR